MTLIERTFSWSFNKEIKLEKTNFTRKAYFCFQNSEPVIEWKIVAGLKYLPSQNQDAK